MLWWILGGIVVLIVLVLWMRLGVYVTFGGDRTTVDLTIGPFKIRLSPTETGEEKTEKKPEKEPEKQAEKTRTQLPKALFATIRSAVAALAPAGKKALHRTRKSIKIHPLRLSVIIGGSENAAEAAQHYGYAQAAVWTVMPPLEELLVIPDPRIHIGLDFGAATIQAEGEVGARIRIGTLISLGLCLGIPALKWYLSYRKQSKEQPPVSTATDTTAA
ncbi:MAG: hypothetical protein RRY97_04155 [Oscillibacter sp.]